MTDEKEIEITVYCNGCDNTDYAEKSELEKIGWRIDEVLELCPICNF
jgi:hypothetical protein